MLIPDLNIFFVHIPKCAGVSIELFFFKRDGLDFQQHHIVRQLTDKQRAYYRHGDYLQKEQGVKLNGPAQHFTGPQARKYVPEFESCYRFAIVRNPWDRLVSEYLWQKQTLRKHIQFKDLVKQVEQEQAKRREGSAHYIPQWMYIYNDKDEKLVNDVFKVENMQEVENTLNSKFNLGMKLTKSNTTKRDEGKQHYTDYYDEQLKKTVHNIYAKDIELFNYSYGQ